MYDIVAHEFSHLANHVWGGDYGHGEDFFDWLSRANDVFPGLGLTMNEFHEYKIEWKFRWKCAGQGCDGAWEKNYRPPKTARCPGCRRFIRMGKS